MFSSGRMRTPTGASLQEGSHALKYFSLSSYYRITGLFVVIERRMLCVLRNIDKRSPAINECSKCNIVHFPKAAVFCGYLM